MEQARYKNFTDMINGGGVGAEGPSFTGGGILSTFGNHMRAESDYRQQWAEQQRAQHMQQVLAQLRGDSQPTSFGQMFGQGFRPRHHSQTGRPRLRDYNGLGDMFDGGGAGQSGQAFAGGGLFSVLGNLAGAKPKGQA